MKIHAWNHSGCALLLRAASVIGLLAFAMSSDAAEVQSAGISRQLANEDYKTIDYGKTTYIQSASFRRKWLRGGEGDGSEGRIKDVLSDNSQSNRAKYRFRFFDKNGRDKSGCVKFGATVTIEDKDNGKYMRPWRDDTQIRFHGIPQSDNKWVLRSNIGGGKYDDPDPAKGECVRDFHKVYIQSTHQKFLWLKAGATDGVWLDDWHENADPEDLKNYEWILQLDTKTGDPLDGRQWQPPVKECKATKTSGGWEIERMLSATTTDLTYTRGVTATRETSFEHTSSWDVSVGLSMEANFAVGSVTVDTSYGFGQEVMHSITDTIELEKTEDITYGFEEVGILWVFQGKVEDDCERTAIVRTENFVWTPTRNEPPCCLPNYFNNPYDAHYGGCLPDSPCICGEYCAQFEPEEEDGEKGSSGGSGSSGNGSSGARSGGHSSSRSRRSTSNDSHHISRSDSHESKSESKSDSRDSHDYSSSSRRGQSVVSSGNNDGVMFNVVGNTGEITVNLNTKGNGAGGNDGWGGGASYGDNLEEEDYEMEYLDMMLEALKAMNNPKGGDFFY